MKKTSTLAGQKFDIQNPTLHYDNDMWLKTLKGFMNAHLKQINSTERKILAMQEGQSIMELEQYNDKYKELKKDLAFHHQSYEMFDYSYQQTLLLGKDQE